MNEYYLRDHTGREVAIYNNGGTTLKSINLFGNGLLSADAVSIGAKGTDAIFFNGSTNAVANQAIKVGGNFVAGRILNAGASRVVTRTGLGNVLFRGSSGQFVNTNFGYTTEAVRDATKIAIGLGF